MRFAKSRTQLTNFHFKDFEDGQTSPRQERGEEGSATDRAPDPFQPHLCVGDPHGTLDFSNIEKAAKLYVRTKSLKHFNFLC